jgi:hypothetical protein
MVRGRDIDVTLSSTNLIPCCDTSRRGCTITDIVTYCMYIRMGPSEFYLTIPRRQLVVRGREIDVFLFVFRMQTMKEGNSTASTKETV